MNNLEYFEYSKEHPEGLIDPYYAKDFVVIPDKVDDFSMLTANNDRMIELISKFKELHELGKDSTDDDIEKIINKICHILDNTPGINYSAFSQFFMVYNFTYSLYQKLSGSKKFEFIYEMLIRYCKERHEMYMSHGYSNMILQVMCDNYSHKRNGKTGINKILALMRGFNMVQSGSLNYFVSSGNHYILPDKGDRVTFEKFLKTYFIKMKSREIAQDKLPDIVFSHNGHFYICELKSMKESGGGQNHTVMEFANFINYSEINPNIHYITFLDCEYSNLLFSDNSPKISLQRKAVIDALTNNPQNYFLNTEGMKKFLADVFSA